VQDYDEDALLHQEDIVLFLCSTWTDGTPPEAATRFVAWLDEYVNDFRVSKSHLANVKYAVFGLGSAIYADNFCKVTRQVDEHLKELGARPLLYPMYGDDQTDLESKFIAWSSSAVDILKSVVSSQSLSTMPSTTTETSKTVSKNGVKSSVYKLQKKLEKQLKASSSSNGNDSSCCSAKDDSGCCSSNDKTDRADSNTCSNHNNNNDVDVDDVDDVDVDEEEEDRINSKYVTMDQYETDSDDGSSEVKQTGHDDIIDMEDLGKEMSESKKQLMEDMKGG
jgi:sulfite reductase alpha subunit-like flavoprotein